MSFKDQIRQIWLADPDFSRSQVAEDFGINRKTVYNYITDFKRESDTKTKEPKNNSANLRTISVSNLIDNERLDTAKIIRDGISKIPMGQVAYDDVFRRELQVVDSKWRQYSKHEEFDEFRATLPNRKVIWGAKSTIIRVKEMDGVT